MKPETVTHIAIVDDDPQIGDLLQDFLTKHGFSVVVANDATALDALLAAQAIDLIVLDVMMPGEDGVSVCRRLRQDSNIPVIMLSAVSAEVDRIIGLEMGADDYLAKPFSPRELLARIKALLRRVQDTPPSSERDHARLPMMQSSFIYFDKWTLDCNKRQLLAPDDLAIPLSKGEYELLWVFLQHAGRTLSRDQLLDLARGREAIPFDRSVDVQVARLRKKIEIDAKNPKLIITIRGGGYQLTVKPGSHKKPGVSE